MRARARKLGTRFWTRSRGRSADRRRPCGAVGFDIVTGRFYIMRAKAVILANGSCRLQGRRFWVAGTGDGVARPSRRCGDAQREFGISTGNGVQTRQRDGRISAPVNSAGENLAQKYRDEGPAAFPPVQCRWACTERFGRPGPVRFAPPSDGPPHEPPADCPSWAPDATDGGEGERLWAASRREREIGAPLHGRPPREGRHRCDQPRGLVAIGDTSYAGFGSGGSHAFTPGSRWFRVMSRDQRAWAAPSPPYAAEAPRPRWTARRRNHEAAGFRSAGARDGLQPAEAIWPCRT